MSLGRGTRLGALQCLGRRAGAGAEQTEPTDVSFSGRQLLDGYTSVYETIDWVFFTFITMFKSVHDFAVCTWAVLTLSGSVVGLARSLGVVVPAVNFAKTTVLDTFVT